MPDVHHPDRPGGGDDLELLLARFRAEHPDGDAAAFEAWLLAAGPALRDARVSALVGQVLDRLDDSGDGDASLFAPPGARPTSSPTSAPSFAAGDRVGPFVLRRFIAAGGMGQVWEATEEALDRTVALKLLLPGRLDERTLARFAREARAGGRLRHPNLVTTFAFGWDEGLSWISQELVGGARTLADELHDQRARDVLPDDWYRHLAERVADLADGLHAAHEAGVVHRDVKPANVLVAEDGTLRLTDFGLARVVDETALSQTGDLAGTWAYMSPEQVRARRGAVDRRTDVYSLGVVLYELLTLRRPFDGDTVEQTVEQILTQDPPAPTRLRSACPADLSWICLKAIEKSRDHRYPTAAALAADLRRHLASEPIVARPPSRIDRARRWARRHPAPATAVAVGLAALVVVSGLLVRRASDALALERLAKERDFEARAAEEERAALLRLSAAVALDDLDARQAALWPPHPERIPALRAWLDDARALLESLPEHRRRLAALRDAVERSDASEETRWWTARLEPLVQGLEALRDGHLDPERADPETGWSVARRLAFAERLAAEFAPGGDAERRWRDALPALRAAHPDVEFEPWTGFVPLGPDPDSGLWEFAHLATGEAPERGPGGRLATTDAASVVLVLVPGGTFHAGAQAEDPDAPNHVPDGQGWGYRPVRELTLSPYLIGKHEITQGQWVALTGTNPSWYRAGDDGITPRHPVEGVTWSAARTILDRVGLTLPSEARWEHACRAGTGGDFCFGDTAAANGKFNVADRTGLAADPSFPRDGHSDTLDDGFAFHAPVGTFPANAFGLHELHGNVNEWVLDAARYGEYAEDEPGIDPLVDPAESDRHVVRSGAYNLPSLAARSYFRMALGPHETGTGYGVRAAADVPPVADVPPPGGG